MSESNKAVFLSYTSNDADAARRICESLQEAGIEVWLDQSELRGGDAWDAAIRNQIKACAMFMPVISANTSARVEGFTAAWPSRSRPGRGSRDRSRITSAGVRKSAVLRALPQLGGRQ